ncbi:hypothetical protein [Paenibacillus cymbidii]|uniref:hypothetical protein n=1 Tax=Paenibacillus cymbidii TaxID=1639034 RepID=UPI001081D237|nr:hypothetical protein [Paenibacillus cymbidii]
MSDAVSRKALLERLQEIKKEHYEARNDGDYIDRYANTAVSDWFGIVIDELESGAFSESEGEAAKLRELLVKLDTYVDFSQHLDNGDWGIEDASGINGVFDEIHAALSTSETAKCTTCGGEGDIYAEHYGETSGGICPACKGTGLEPMYWHECRPCEGTGKIFEGIKDGREEADAP